MSYTCASIETTFKVVNKYIVSPGQFEGQPRFTPYFHEKSEKRGKTLISIRDEDHAEFPELQGYKVILLNTLTDGRVTATPYLSMDF